MFNNGTNFQVHGGSFYNVSGDVNLETHQHQHLTRQDDSAHEAGRRRLLTGSTLALEYGRDESSSNGASGVVRRTPCHRTGTRQTPYPIPYRSRLRIPSTSLLPFSSSAHLSTVPAIGPGLSLSMHEAQHPSTYQHGSLTDLWNLPTDAFFELGDRQELDTTARSSSRDSRYNGDLDRIRVDTPPTTHPGTYITTQNVNHRYGETGIHILHRAVALEALYDSAESFPQPRCHPETRTKMLDDLYNWAVNEDSVYSICWLHGPAGAGKSAIMQTLCQRLQDTGRLGGSFFFKRGHPSRGNAKVLFATLAYQLALHHHNLHTPISRRIEADPSILGRGMETQLWSLIIEPCRFHERAAPPILLIDGLDECEGHSSQLEILRLIGSAAHDSSISLRILIASRPEMHIRETFDEESFHGLHESINIEQAFDDVRTFLRDEFARIHREHQDTMQNIPTPWPPNNILNSLVQKSSGYFIYASTVIRFIDDKRFRPTERLEAIQNLNVDDSDSPLASLDQLYLQILSAVPARFRADLCDILAVVARLQLLPEQIDLLLGLKPGDVWLTLRCLHSVLEMYSKRHVIHVHHASFLDFLQDPDRASIFYITPQNRMNLARSLLKALAYTHEDRDTNRTEFPLPWSLGESCKWIECITSVEINVELVPLVRIINPDFLSWGFISEIIDQEINHFVIWLKGIWPVPESLIQCWEDYQFIRFYESSNHRIRDALLTERNVLAPQLVDRDVLSPSLQIILQLNVRMNSSRQVALETWHAIFSHSPHLSRIIQARKLLSDDRSYLSPSFSLGWFHIRILLDLSWDDIRVCICLLHPIVGQEFRKLCELFIILPALRRELHNAHPEALVSKDLACGFIRLIQRIAIGDLPMMYWKYFTPGGHGQYLEWGRHVRSSPQSNPELLDKIREFVPPWNVFGCQLCPSDFYDVVQWLKAFPDPPFEVIESWEGFLMESMNLSGTTYSDHELDARWQDNLKREVDFHRPPQVLDEEIISCWEGCLQTAEST